MTDRKLTARTRAEFEGNKPNQAERNRAFVKAAAAGDWKQAAAIARPAAPSDATTADREDWEARRRICRICRA